MRWAAIAAQILTIAGVHFGLGVHLPLGPLAMVIAIEFVINCAALFLCRSQRGTTSSTLGGFFVADLLVLTALLYLTGGPLNPFSILYIVHIALAAVMLPARWTWAIGLASILCFGFLFIDHVPLPMQHEEGAMHWHVPGMWFAFVVAAGLITLFVGRLSRRLEARNAQLAEAREKALRTEKLAALGTLSTGAAHELATPLSTIAVVASDLEHEFEQGEVSDELREDARLIRDQVDRCRAIIDQLAVDTGQTLGEVNETTTLESLFEEALDPLLPGKALTIEMRDGLADATLFAPIRTLAHAIRALVDNALQASPAPDSVELVAAKTGQGICIEVTDAGPGMSPEVRQRATEPFFTTKAPEEGTGLGLFLAQSVADSLDGELRLESSTHGGTRATLDLPLQVATSPSSDEAS